MACALSIRRRMAALNAARAREGLFTLRLVVALPAGDLLVGVFDDGVRAEYTVLGPAMNALARIETQAKAAENTRFTPASENWAGVEASTVLPDMLVAIAKGGSVQSEAAKADQAIDSALNQ